MREQGERPSETARLLVRHTTQAGQVLHFRVGPFVYPPAQIGGRVDVIYDPRDPTNAETPEDVPSGKFWLALTALSAGAFLLCLTVILLTF
ncbi:hypothetical protein ACWD6R_21510 [Streptomyces sp. NPDC005151]